MHETFSKIFFFGNQISSSLLIDIPMIVTALRVHIVGFRFRNYEKGRKPSLSINPHIKDVIHHPTFYEGISRYSRTS